jgi:hypothetical protein
VKHAETVRFIALSLFVLLFAIALVGGLVWANLNFVQRIGGGEQFFTLWFGVRSYILTGIPPYDSFITTQIQQAAYGRPAIPGEPPLLFDTPLYAGLTFLPLALVENFALARAIWQVVLQLAALAVGLISLHMIAARPGWFKLVAFLAVSVLWFPALDALVMGSPAALSALFFIAALNALRLEQDELAGFLFVMGAYRLEAFVLALTLVLFWLYGQGRTRVFVGMGITLFALVSATLILNPEWLWYWFINAISNLLANWQVSTFRLFVAWFPGLGDRFAWGLAIITSWILISEWRTAPRLDFSRLLWLVSLTLVLTPLIGFPIQTGNFVFYILPLAIILDALRRRWRTTGVVFGWAILAMLLLVPWLEAASVANPRTALIFPITIFFIISLYWVRWWVFTIGGRLESQI